MECTNFIWLSKATLDVHLSISKFNEDFRVHRFIAAHCA